MKKKYIHIFRSGGIKFDIINHHFMLGFVISGLYFVHNENNFLNPLLQVGSGTGYKNHFSHRAKEFSSFSFKDIPILLIPSGY